MSDTVYGRVVKKNTVGTEDGTLVEWTMDDINGTTVWTPNSGPLYDRMDQAYQTTVDPKLPRNADKVQVEYEKRKITRRGGRTQEVNWVLKAGS